MKNLNNKSSFSFFVSFTFLFFLVEMVQAKPLNWEPDISKKLEQVYSKCLIDTAQDRKQCQQNCGAIIKMCYDQQADFIDSKNSDLLTELEKNPACKDMSSSLSTHIHKIIEDSDNFMSNDEGTSQFQIQTKLYLYRSLVDLKKQCSIKK